MKKILFLSFCILMLPAFVKAQIDNQGPYSFYGIGRPQQMPIQGGNAMGGTYVGINDSSLLNIWQPASLASLDLTQFQVGVEMNAGSREYDNRTYSEFGLHVNQIAIGFPIVQTRRFGWAMAGAFQPLSLMGYDFRDTIQSVIGNDTLPSARRFNGEGGWNRVTLGNGFRIGKSFFFGANGHFNFGSVGRIRTLQFAPNTNILSSKVRDATSTESFSLDIGFQYKGSLRYNAVYGRPDGGKDTVKKVMYFTAGVTFEPSWRAQATRSETGYLYLPGANNDFGLDTFLLNPGIEGNVQMPDRYGFGFSFGNADYYLIAADVNYHRWSQFRFFNQNIPIYFDEWRFGIGTQVRPFNLKNKVNGVKFKENLVFRAGLRYVSRGLQPQQVPVDEYGITFGMGIPMNHRYVRNINNTLIRRTGSFINLGADVTFGEPRGNVGNRDLFFRIHLGLLIREWWFDRPMFN